MADLAPHLDPCLHKTIMAKALRTWSIINQGQSPIQSVPISGVAVFAALVLHNMHQEGRGDHNSLFLVHVRVGWCSIFRFTTENLVHLASMMILTVFAQENNIYCR
jgi:hypothetical protein